VGHPPASARWKRRALALRAKTRARKALRPGLGAKDLLNNRMAYVAVSRGAYDAQIFTDDREKLGAALGRDVSHKSALTPEKTPEIAVAPKIEIEREIWRGHGIGR
jgi:hypothetical protein